MVQRAPQDQEKFVLRLPDGMRDRIRAAADANGRSMNAEIVKRLADSFDMPKSLGSLSDLLMDASIRLKALEMQSTRRAGVLGDFDPEDGESGQE